MYDLALVVNFLFLWDGMWMIDSEIITAPTVIMMMALALANNRLRLVSSAWTKHSHDNLFYLENVKHKCLALAHQGQS